MKTDLSSFCFLISDHVMILLRILAFKFSNGPVYMIAQAKRYILLVIRASQL